MFQETATETAKGFLAEDVYSENDKVEDGDDKDESKKKELEEEEKSESGRSAVPGEGRLSAGTKKPKPPKEAEPTYVKHKYDLNEKWSQTIDFPRKKKGTQTDPIVTYESHAQVTSKDLLL